MEKRYQVFVSSTFEDLQEERREVMQALLGLKCIPTGMELFPAADDDSTQVIKRFIADCDYYVLIVGGRYGSTLPDGKSYTEMEYEYALEAKLPILAFLHGDPGTLPSKKTEQTDAGKTALGDFRKRIMAARHTKSWMSPKELALGVYQGMSALLESKPRTGWVRANQVANESAAQEILGLLKKIDELNAHIAQNELTPPEGTEDLSKGNEEITLHFRYEEPNGGLNDAAMAFSWDDFAALLGPILLTQASEGEMKKKLSEAFGNRFKDKFGARVYRQYMRDEEFQQVKLQLRALGLIREVREKSPSGGDSAIWTLTPYGDRVMTQVAAIRSSHAPKA